MTTAVAFKNVDIRFGKATEEGLRMLDAGSTRAEILDKTGVVLGAAKANLMVREGEISVLMGLSGSGKSTLLRAVNGLNKVTAGQVLVKDGGRGASSGPASPCSSCGPMRPIASPAPARPWSTAGRSAPTPPSPCL